MDLGESIHIILLVAGSEPVFENKKVLLLEAAAQRKRQQLPDTFGSRVCALSAGTVRLLESMFVVFLFVFLCLHCQL